MTGWRDPQRRRWWTAFLVTCVVVLVAATGVGQYLAGRREPRQVGTSTVGEWVDLSEYGFRIRVDDVAVASELPHRTLPDQTATAPDGLTYFRVMLTVEVRVEQGEDMGCLMYLFNADGEQLDKDDWSVGSADAVECTLFEGREELGVGDTFETQFVRVVPPADADAFTLRIHPTFSDSRVYWLVTF